MKNRKDFGKLLLSCILIFLCTCSICMGILFTTALIPQQWIQNGSEKTALYFMENQLFPCLVEGKISTKYDNYADCISFHVAYQMDVSKPFQAIVQAAYYDHPRRNVNDDYYKAVFEGKKSNAVYFRYWHGSLCVLRPLLCFIGVLGIRRVLAVVLVSLNLILSVLLWRKKQRELLAIYIISLLLIKIWVVPCSIEYVMAFLVMTVVTIGFVLFEKAENKYFLYLSVLSGVLTNFFDFLTVETITITVPLLFLLVLKNSQGRLGTWKEELKFITVSGSLWVTSYVGMFLVKWGLSVMFMGKKALLEVVDTASYRINSGEGAENNIFRGIIYNISCLFSGREVSIGAVVFIVLMLVVLFARGTEFHRLLLILGVIPYIRYFVINSHSIVHYFFTYRAQLVTIMAILVVIFQKGKILVKVGKQQ